MMCGDILKKEKDKRAAATPEQLEKIKTGESPLVDSLLEHFALEAEEPLNQELDYSVVNRDTEQVLGDWE